MAANYTPKEVEVITTGPGKLTTQAVRDLLLACSGTEDDLRVEGICGYFLFNREKLRENRQAIIELLYELPTPFQIAHGGGWSFLQACYDKHGYHWAEHPTMDALFCLGIGIDVVGYVLPREAWSVFPGGMPYIYIKDCYENPQQDS